MGNHHSQGNVQVYTVRIPVTSQAGAFRPLRFSLGARAVKKRLEGQTCDATPWALASPMARLSFCPGLSFGSKP